MLPYNKAIICHKNKNRIKSEANLKKNTSNKSRSITMNPLSKSLIKKCLFISHRMKLNSSLKISSLPLNKNSLYKKMTVFFKTCFSLTLLKILLRMLNYPILVLKYSTLQNKFGLLSLVENMLLLLTKIEKERYSARIFNLFIRSKTCMIKWFPM